MLVGMGLNTEAIKEALRTHLLPQLDINALARLSCCSRQLRTLVYDAPAQVWEPAARKKLPVGCALPRPSTRAQLQAALLRYHKALHGLRSGQWHHTMHSSFPEPQFSSTGMYLASVRESSVIISSSSGYEQVVQLHFGEDGEDWVRFRWCISGTRAGIIAKSLDGASVAYLGDMLDPLVQQQGRAALQRVPILEAQWEWEQFNGPNWSPDLTKLLMSDGPRQIGKPVVTAVFDTATGHEIWSSLQEMPVPPVWRPDSASILFYSRVAGLRSLRHTEQIVSIPSGRTVWSSSKSAATGHVVNENKHGFSPDGLKVYSTYPAQQAAIVMLLSDGSLLQTLQGYGHNVLVPDSLSWAPDSLQIAACCTMRGVPHPTRDTFLGIWHIALGRLVTLTVGHFLTADTAVDITGDVIFAWTPDALHLAVFCPTSSVHDRIGIVSVASQATVCSIRTQPFALGPEYSMFELGWSPDASQLVVSFIHRQAMTAHPTGNGNGHGNGNGSGDTAGAPPFTNAIVRFVD